MKLRIWAMAAFLAGLPTIATAQSVVTYHNSIARDGNYIVPGLTHSAAANVHLDKAFNAAVDGNIYTQPLYWKPEGAKRGLVITATESNIVYALDELSGAIKWKTTLAPSVPHSDLPCGNLDPSGITGTPVIDPESGTLYLDALTATKRGPRHLVYALSIADGKVLPKWPFDAQAALSKVGVTFSSSTQGERSALLFFQNAVFVNYGGNDGDCGVYHGTVLQIAPKIPKLVGNWETRAQGGGIWAQGGIAGDGTDLFVTTGNTMNANTWGDGEGILRLRFGLTHSFDTKDYFTPTNWKQLDDDDLDLGGTEALPIDISVPGSKKPARRVIAFGKDGNAYLVERANLGGIGGALGILQVSTDRILSAPAVYREENDTLVAFTSFHGSKCSEGSITMVKVAARGSSPLSFDWCKDLYGRGEPIITTIDGIRDPIVWVVGAQGDNMLHGFNALNGKVVFSGKNTTMDGLHHFVTILATANRFYVAADNKIYAFVTL